eukprot:412696-Prymnesium_polylepis.2
MPKVPRRKKVAPRRKGVSKDKTPMRSATRQTKNRVLVRMARDKAFLEELEKREKQPEPRKTPAARKRKAAEATPVTEEVKPKRTKQDEAEQRVVIKYYYRKLQSPPEEDWDGQCGTISEIRRRIGEDAPGSATVRRTLELLAADHLDVTVLGKRKCERTLDDEDDLYIGLLICEGYSQRDALDAINADRAEDGLDPISRQQIRDAEKRVELLTVDRTRPCASIIARTSRLHTSNTIHPT